MSPEWSERLGLPSGVDVAVGIIDAHAGAIGAGIKGNTMVKIIGTSTCDIVISSVNDIGDKLIPGISGQVDGSVIPGFVGVEAGQSSFGDVYAWFRNILTWPVESLSLSNSITENQKELFIDKILPKLTSEAQALSIDASDSVASDWFNGRRTPYANQTLKGGLTGLMLGATPAHIFKALVEATAFGSKAIMDHLRDENVIVNEVIGVGGIALKSPYVMQTLSDVMEVPIRTSAAQQAGALGAAICAAAAAGIYDSVFNAQDALQ